MTPGQPIEFHRGGPTLYTGRVVRICQKTKAAIVGDIRRPDGRVVMTTGSGARLPLQLRVAKSGTVLPLFGFGGEMWARGVGA